MNTGRWEEVMSADRWWSAEAGNALNCLKELPDNSVDLILCSPHHEDARTYSIGCKRKGQDWVDEVVPIYLECVRVCRGLVAWVVEGKTRNFQYSATPMLLAADLHRAGVKLRKPPIYKRFGIAGSGGSDFLKNDYEFVICSSKGKLPWSDNTAMGHPPKWAPGGEMSYRLTDGTRRNQWGKGEKGGQGRDKHGKKKKQSGRPSHEFTTPREVRGTGTRGSRNGDIMTVDGAYKPPKLANPGNVINVIVGGGVMGDKLCHKNEAPYAESFCEFMIRSFCPPGGIVGDPFCGGGTTPKVAVKFMRRAIAFDIRESQITICSFRVPLALTLLHPGALEIIKNGGRPECPGKVAAAGSPGGEDTGSVNGEAPAVDTVGPASIGSGEEPRKDGSPPRSLFFRGGEQDAADDSVVGVPDCADGGDA